MICAASSLSYVPVSEEETLVCRLRYLIAFKKNADFFVMVLEILRFYLAALCFCFFCLIFYTAIRGCSIFPDHEPFVYGGKNISIYLLTSKMIPG